MHILLLTHIFPPATDGGSKIIAKVGEYLQNKGHLTLAITSNHYTTDDFVKPKAIVVDRTDKNIIRLAVYHLHRRLPKPIFKFIPFFKTLITIFRFKPDWIIAGPFPTTIPIYALIFKFIFKSKLCLIPCFHQFDPEFSHKSLIFCLRHSDLICTLTQHESLILNSKYNISNNKFFLMRAGVDKSLIINKLSRRFPSKRQIVFLGNFSAHKRVELLIQAFSKLEFSNLKLVLAGQSTLYWPKIKLVIDLQPTEIKKNISIHLKNYSTKDLIDYLTPGSILVLPSVHESFGLVFIESLARGIPVIGTDIPPIKELLNYTGGGLTFKKDNLDDLVFQINQLLNNSLLYSKLSKTGNIYVKKHLSWDTIVDRLWEKLKS